MNRLFTFIFLCLFPAFCFAQIQDDIFVQTDRFLKKYVVNGQVQYGEIVKNKKELDALVKRLEAINYTNFYDNLRKTYLINSYNLLAIKGVADKYPILTTNEVKGFFSDTKYVLNKKNLSLDYLEKELLLRPFNDPRIIFALIKPANGMGFLPNFAFNPQKIDAELEAHTKAVLNNSAFVKVYDGNVVLPQTFEWNKELFQEKGIVSFLNKYLEKKTTNDASISYYPFDWTLNDNRLWQEKQKSGVKTPTTAIVASIDSNHITNLQQLTPARLLPKGRTELKTFNTLYTYNQIFGNVPRINAGFRSSTFTSVNQLMFSPTNQLNVGIEFWVKSTLKDTTNGSLGAFFGTNNANYTHTGISGIGPKIKLQPFKNHPNLTLQTTFLIPFSRDLEGRKSKKPYLSADAASLITQLLYDRTFREKWQLFTQISPIFTLGKSVAQSRMAMPMSVYVGYLLNARTMIYLQNEVFPQFGKEFIQSAYLNNGLGMKFQLIPNKLELEGAYHLRSIGYKTSAGSGFDLGLRWVK